MQQCKAMLADMCSQIDKRKGSQNAAKLFKPSYSAFLVIEFEEEL